MAFVSDEHFNNPFGVLKGTVPELKGPSPSAPKVTIPAAPGPSPTVPRAVVRMERSGRGGKEVTVIEHMALSPKQREEWLKALKAGLGCGGVIEGEALVLQGDQRKRVPKLLEARGVKKITISG
ncbi:MAG: translation initiation factor [Acidobacteria bacterium]|nr:MAG: translation initiation factor [Acidobacteriota bacterium]